MSVRRRFHLSWASVLASVALACGLASCSPGYVLQAGWEEAGILWKREGIESLLAEPDIDSKVKHKFLLTLALRNYAAQIGLTPKGSFQSYSALDKKELVWVVNAAPQNSLQAKTWWFPLVGSVQYRGYFDKADAEDAVANLAQEGFDTFLRPSPAFSTLGWFDDPLLSTIIDYDDVSFANTILHELFHNTYWIKNHTSFNETAANAFAWLATIEFYSNSSWKDMELKKRALDLWQEQLLFSRQLADLNQELSSFYKDISAHPPSDWLEQKLDIFRRHGLKAQQQDAKLALSITKLNNASLLAHIMYLDRIALMEQLNTQCRYDLNCWQRALITIITRARTNSTNPYDELDIWLKSNETQSRR